MIRSLSIAALSAGIALPAFAEETATIDAGQTAQVSAGLTHAAAAQKAQKVLASRGYVNISSLERDESGRWFGTAFKDGAIVIVAVDLRRPPAETVTN